MRSLAAREASRGLCTQGNCSTWVSDAAAGDVNGSAVQYLKMVKALNSALLLRAEAVCKDSTDVGVVSGEPLLRLIDHGLSNRVRAADVMRLLEKELRFWTLTPVLRVLDEHNELWKKLGDDVRAWPPVFRDYAEFESLRGVSPVRTCRMRCAVSDAHSSRA